MTSQPKHQAPVDRPSTRLRVLIFGALAVLTAAALVLILSSAYRLGQTELMPVAPMQSNANATTITASNAVPQLSSTVQTPTNAAESQVADVERAAGLVNHGNELLEAGKVPEAVAQYQLAVKLNPEDEDTHYSLALALAKQGRRDAAQAEYLEALRIYPEYTEAHNNLGNLLVAEGKFAEAIPHFQAALKTAPDHFAAQSNLGNALARQGKIAEAIPYFQEALRLNPDYVEARYNLANAYALQGRVEEAIAEFNDVLRRRPDFELARRALARVRPANSK